MAVSNVPVFAVTPRITSATATTLFALTGAGSVLDNNPSNTVLLWTAGSLGSLMTDITVIPRATLVACWAGLFYSTDSGTNKVLLSTVLLAAQTLSTTVAVVEYKFTVATESLPMRMSASDRLYFGISATNASGINCFAKGVDY